MNNPVFKSIAKRLAATPMILASVAIFAFAQAAAQSGASQNHFDRAKKLAAEDNLKAAAQEYKQAIDGAGGKYAEAHNNLGMVYGMMGDSEQAVREFLTAIEQRG